ncbi:MAG TPA: permease prefix domain 1-containing protein [Desulfuromonadaceae bacterium]|nr:permease prefix domain 1-containing protein [Desulfuromonadaceae bacterium]
MEPQTRFDLNTAVNHWRTEMAFNLTAEDRRELETHLQDTMTELRQRGLNDEESFWLACHRVGRPQPLAEELEKANPGKIWRERVFWMVLAYLVISLWGSTVNAVINLLHFSRAVHQTSTTQFVATASHYIFSLLPVVVFAMWLVKGKLSLAQERLAGFFSTKRLIVYALGWSVANSGLDILFLVKQAVRMSSGYIILDNCLFQIIRTAALVAILVWLMPKTERIKKTA